MLHPSVSSPAARPRDRRHLRAVDVALPMLVGVLAFGYRFLSHQNFSNDDYVHLARAQAMLLGDLPIRDYVEEGMPLNVLLSAVSQRLVGYGPLAELIFIAASLAIAAAVTCWLATRLTGSRALGLMAALLQIAATPRPFGHPKILVYPVLFLCTWWYLKRPTTGRLGLVAGWTAVAFLLRHDHGVYAGIGTVVTLLIAHSRDGVRRMVRQSLVYAVMLLALLSPYLLYVQWNIGLIDYFRLGISASERESERQRRELPHFAPLASGPLLVRPAIPDNELPIIHIRWRSGTSDDVRAHYESELRLRHPQPAGDTGRTFEYRIEPWQRSSLSRITSIPEVEEYDGFSPRTLLLRSQQGLAAVPALLHLSGLAAGPPIESALAPENALAFLFYLAWALPFVALALWSLLPRHDATSGIASGSTVYAGALIPGMCVVAIVCNLGFIRELLGHRISDVYGTLPILAVWTAAALGAFRPRRGIRRALASVAIGVWLLPVVLTTAVNGGVLEEIDRAEVYGGIAGMSERAREVVAQGTTRPWKDEWPVGQDWRLAQYVHDCTRPTDRLLVTWTAAHFNFFSERAFAGGETLLLPVFRPPETIEPKTLKRLRTQRVPIILSEADDWATFTSAYPQLAAYIDTRYREAGVANFGRGHTITVHVDTSLLPTGADPQFGFPCFN